MSNLPPSALTREVAAILRAARARRNISQTVLAAASDVSQSQLSKMLLGTRPITLDQLDLMCVALSLDIVEVLTEADEVTRNRHLAESGDDTADATAYAADELTRMAAETRESETDTGRRHA